MLQCTQPIVTFPFLFLISHSQINVLALACQKKAKDKYAGAVELILGAARQIREEVSSMEVDILVSENMTELLERTRPQMESIAHEVHMATLAASSMFTLINLRTWRLYVLLCVMFIIIQVHPLLTVQK